MFRSFCHKNPFVHHRHLSSTSIHYSLGGAHGNVFWSVKPLVYVQQGHHSPARRAAHSRTHAREANVCAALVYSLLHVSFRPNPTCDFSAQILSQSRSSYSDLGTNEQGACKWDATQELMEKDINSVSSWSFMEKLCHVLISSKQACLSQKLINYLIAMPTAFVKPFSAIYGQRKGIQKGIDCIYTKRFRIFWQKFQKETRCVLEWKLSMSCQLKHRWQLDVDLISCFSLFRSSERESRKIQCTTKHLCQILTPTTTMAIFCSKKYQTARRAILLKANGGAANGHENTYCAWCGCTKRVH